MKSLETFSRLPELLGEIEGFKPAAEGLLGAFDQLTSSDIPALVRRAAPGIIREFDTFRAYLEGLADRLEGD